MNTGMTFGMEGPQITGWWVNPKTGDKFNAVDTFFEDNQLLIKAADGRLFTYNQIQNYIQTKDPSSVKIEAVTTGSKKGSDLLPPEILNELETPGEETINDIIIPDDDIFSSPAPTPAPKVTPGKKSPVTTDYTIIERALGGKTEPSTKVSVTWKDFPFRSMELLVDVMGISKESIIDYYTNNIDVTEILEEIKRSLAEYIETKLKPDSSSTVSESSNTLTKKSAKKK